MSIIMVADFGDSEKDNVKRIRVNGDRKDLEFLISELEKNNANFLKIPIIYPTYSTYTVLLEIILPGRET